MPRALRVFASILVSLVLLAVIGVASVADWFFFYTSDLPDMSAIAAFAPPHPTSVQTNMCGSSVQILAVPEGDMGMMPAAVLAAEGDFDPRGTLKRYFDEASDLPPGRKYGFYSWQLARQMFCNQTSGHLKRQFAEMRTAHQLDRRFSHEQLLSIYLNRAYFGAETYGVESAAERHFGKQAKDLTIAESALLAGLIKSPSYLSPTRHPDRAMARRNEVIDAMVQRGSIGPEQANLAKAMPLGTVPATKSAQE